MSGASEVPAKTTDGKGTASATLDTATKLLTYDVEYAGLSGPATAAHLHGPAEAGANAGVVLPFAAPASPIKGTATLTDAQVTDLMAGKWYANVHTAANPGGEIRGQLARAPSRWTQRSRTRRLRRSHAPGTAASPAGPAWRPMGCSIRTTRTPGCGGAGIPLSSTRSAAAGERGRRRQ